MSYPSSNDADVFPLASVPVSISSSIGVIRFNTQLWGTNPSARQAISATSGSPGSRRPVSTTFAAPGFVPSSLLNGKYGLNVASSSTFSAPWIKRRHLSAEYFTQRIAPSAAFFGLYRSLKFVAPGDHFSCDGPSAFFKRFAMEFSTTPADDILPTITIDTQF